MQDITETYDKIADGEPCSCQHSHMSREKTELLSRYFIAFSNFYQLIPLKRAFRIINDQNEGKYTEEEFLDFAEERYEEEEGRYYLILGKEELYDDAPESEPFDRVLVHVSIVEVDIDVYYMLEDAKREKPYYIPPKDELLKYSDELYAEKTPQYEAMKAFLAKETGHDEKNLEGILDEILFTVRSEDYSPNEALRLAGMFDKKMRFNEKQYNKFTKLYYELHNNTRNPFNNGFTPAELYKMNGDAHKSRYLMKIPDLNILANEPDDDLYEYQIIPPKKAKAGRNDPCPCGSGKKYKKCCGQ